MFRRCSLHLQEGAPAKVAILGQVLSSFATVLLSLTITSEMLFLPLLLYMIQRVKCTLNGVKKSGVLSPILFNVYINTLILLVSEQGVGCHFHGQFVGVFIYANDITLLAPTSRGKWGKVMTLGKVIF